MVRRRLALAVAGALTVGLVLGAVAARDRSASHRGPEIDRTEGAGAAPTSTSVEPDTTSTPSSTASEPRSPCSGLVATPGPAVANPSLTEASGLVASQREPGVLWAVNDSGHRPIVFAIGPDGADLGRFAIPVDAVDIEDVAAFDGQLYLADIGDNGRARAEVAVYRFDEPVLDPGSETEIDESAVVAVDRIAIRYPDRPHDAEAFFVDPATGDLVIIEKELRIGGSDRLLGPAPAAVFAIDAGAVAGPGDHEVEARQVATIALDELAEAEPPPVTGGRVRIDPLGIGGLATGADIDAAGETIALRTYATVWLFARAQDQSIAEALTGTGCQAPSVAEDQGEAIAFLDRTGPGFATVSEGLNPPLNSTRPE